MNNDNLQNNERLIEKNSAQSATLKLPENWYLTINTILNRSLSNSTVKESTTETQNSDALLSETLSSQSSTEESGNEETEPLESFAHAMKALCKSVQKLSFDNNQEVFVLSDLALFQTLYPKLIDGIALLYVNALDASEAKDMFDWGEEKKRRIQHAEDIQALYGFIENFYAYLTSTVPNLPLRYDKKYPAPFESNQEPLPNDDIANT